MMASSIFFCLLLQLGILYFNLVYARGPHSHRHKNVHTQPTFLDALLEDMDPGIIPESLDGGPVRVECGFHVMSLGEISEINMDYEMTALFRTKWMDPRLIDGRRHEAIVLSSQDDDQIWIPDVVFQNDKDARFHDVTVPNTMTKIFPNGTVLHSTRMTLQLSCPMNLVSFPMDTQKCSMKLQSFAYGKDELEITWQKNPVVLDPDLELPQFDIDEDSISTSFCQKSYNITGSVSCLRADFTLHRQLGFYVLQTYIPSVLIVILSWLSFWINKDAVPARITLSVTTFLTMTTQMSASSARTPKVSYPKAIDVWLNGCMLFVFASVIEYAFVNDLSRKHPKLVAPGLGGGGSTSGNATRGQPSRGSEALLHGSSFVDRTKWALTYRRADARRRDAAQMLDKTSRVAFPLAFLAFNIIYWPFYNYYIHVHMWN